MSARVRWVSLQAHLVDAIKRRAIARLHRTVAGERFLLRIYLWAEEGIEAEGLADLRRVASQTSRATRRSCATVCAPSGRSLRGRPVSIR